MKKQYTFFFAFLFFFSQAFAGFPTYDDLCTYRKPQSGDDFAPIDVNKLSKDIAPQDDFFGYVNAKWLAENPIPDSKGAWGAFNQLDENSLHTLKSIMEKHATTVSTAAQGSNKQLLGHYFLSGMDSTGANKMGIIPINPLLKGISYVAERDQLSYLMADFEMKGIKQPIGFFAYADQADATKNILYMNQSGLGLPDRDYYFRTDERSKQIREAYKKYIVDLFVLSGETQKNAEKLAAQVYTFEEKLAKATMTLVERRDPYATYNKLSAKELRKLAPNINWELYYKTMGIPNQAEVVLESPRYIKALDSLVAKAPMSMWKAYQSFHVINSTANVLSDDFANLRFDFYGKTLQGRKAMEERWKRVLRSADELMGELMGQEYVKVAFSPQAKNEALALVNNLKKALADRIGQSAWMSSETKAKAMQKLNAIEVKIGYPDKWKTYEGLQIKNQPFVLNKMAATVYETKRNLSRLGKPVDRTEWLMSPQTVNAYYNPSLNEIVFPAAILQPPFFSDKADDACNYGGIGMVIGHELTHGFDDQGRQYDAQGNLKDWWTAEDAEKYNALAKKFIEQYSSYTALDSVYVNGELTQGENIADLGGMIIAYEAFKRAAPNAPTIDGLTPDQRFFINFAQIWRGQMRDETLRTLIYTDPHSPERFRVTGTLSNFQPFYDAYGVKEGHKMYTPLEKRSGLW